MGNIYSIIVKKMFGDEDEEYDFPKTLEEFGYHFNEDEQLRNIETGNGFNFVEKGDNHRYNQNRYEAIGDIITDYVYELLEKEGLERTTIPVDAQEDEPTSFFFQTKDAQSNPDKLLILIHGSGPVKAGQWARSLIMNDCLDSGTQLPYIRWAMSNGYGVIVANTNINTATVGKAKKKIRGSESPEKHTTYLWETFVQPAQAKNVAIVAHSYGGVCVLNLVNTFLKEFKERVFAMAFTDSVHSFQHQETTEETISFFVERGVNWASSYDKLDTKLKTHIDYTPTLSAGTDKHALTSYTSMKSIFKFITKKYCEHTGTPLPEGFDDTPEEANENNSSKGIENLETPMSQEVTDDSQMSQDVTEESQMSQNTENQETSELKDTNKEETMSQETVPSEEMKQNSQMSQDGKETKDNVKSEL
ncbi:cotranscriptional regulator FAM172A-like isoform X2 [Mytilus californianus]|uniref:cotranscriptional regulator FAM172A-like isoform X2 n=1 Tax=Mytilus californianus TaxID=6549 RepID=UPI002246C0FF|nr:cotranscriptional regulator FAM172A-like isoform X2 [Mytilus californianus]